MGKLVSVISGEIYDVAVDIRPTSKTFGKWYGVILNEETRTGFWIPDGFLHGFYVSFFLFRFCISSFQIANYTQVIIIPYHCATGNSCSS